MFKKILTLALICSWFTPVWAVYDSSVFHKEKPLEIMKIKPSGKDVPAGRQIVISFNQPVVPVGKMERDSSEIPITFKPAVQCQWRWLDTSNLACELGRTTALQPATRYEMVIEPGITTQEGRTIEKSLQHIFITKRPKVSYTSIRQWLEPGNLKIRVFFKQIVTKKSVAKHIYFQTSDGQRVKAKVELPTRNKNEPPLPATVSKKWDILPAQTFPLNSQVQLMIEPGLRSIKGKELGIEQRSLVQIYTFPEFKFLGLECEALDGNDFSVAVGEKANKRCNPMRSVSLKFSSPVTVNMLKQQLQITPKIGSKKYNPWQGRNSYTRLDESHYKDQEYWIRLPRAFKAFTDYNIAITNPTALKDEFGRSLTNSVALSFATDHRAPDHHFEHDFSVLEQGVDSELPIYTTNLDDISISYNVLTEDGWSKNKKHKVQPSPLKDIAVKIPLGVRDLIPAESGVVQGYFKTKPDINNESAKNRNWFFGQTTPYYIHAKLGHYNTLVWVTDLATGLPVEGVDVSIYKDTYAPDKKLPSELAIAITNAEGIARLPGTKAMDPKLKHAYVYWDYQTEDRFFIRCQKGKNQALLPLDSKFRVQLYDYTDDSSMYPDMKAKYGHIHTWGTTAQGIYKVGDTVQYKLFVRDQSNEKFVAAPQKGYTLKVTDPMGKVVYEQKNFSLSKFGAYDGELTIPKTGAVGWYDFELTAKFKKNTTWTPIRVLVSDFTPSPFKVHTALNGELFHIGEKVISSTAAMLHSGGPYGEAKTKVRAILKQQGLHPSHPQAKGFWFDVYSEDNDSEAIFSTEKEKLDNKGLLQTTFSLPTSSKILYGQLMVESAVRDDRGKDVASSVTARYVGRDRFVGLKETSWLLTAGQESTVMLLVVDEFGKPVADTAIETKIERLETKAVNVKTAGNAYNKRYEHTWVNTDSSCSLKSTLEAIPCAFTPSQSGSYKITATIKDSKDRVHQTELRQWAIGKGYVMWETKPGHGLEIVPEQENYKVGDTARYLVKNPYQGAKALVTVERFGSIKSWVTTLKSNMEIIEVPVEPNYVPGFFVSVTVMSPRVDKPIDKNQVDLGKPAFRMGYVKTTVKDPYKEILINVKTDKSVYKPSETVIVEFQAQPRHPKPEREPIELAVTVLDESVFDLLSAGRDYFNPYKGFYTLDDLDMANFSLLMRLVGRQKFEKKGANAGGDGGSSLSMRSVFKYVSYWNPSLKTDNDGKAQIKFDLPDNLTGWRILVMAVTPEDLMGLGDYNFKVNQPVEIRPVLPNQVLTGDIFQAGFSVMNRTEIAKDLKVTVTAKGPVITPNANTTTSWMQSVKNMVGLGKKAVNKSYTIKAEPYKRYVQWLPLQTTTAGSIQFEATASDGTDSDGLQKSLQIRARQIAVTAATYGTTVADEITEKVKFPADIYPNVGGLKVIASPTVIGGVDEAFNYMRDYPYACWEQKLTKGTMASHYNNLQDYIADDLTWKDSYTLPGQTINLAKEYQAPNGGMTYFVAKNERVSPYLTAYTALAFNWLRAAEYDIPETVEKRLHSYLLKLLRKNVMPDFYSKGMASSVRATALAALAGHGKITRNDINRYHGHVEYMDLFGKAQFLSAALQVAGTQRIRNDVADKILAHANQTAGKISFSEDLDSSYKHILSSSLRTQCAILSSLSGYDQTMGQQSSVGEVPFKLVRNITKMQDRKGYWGSTQENMYCMNALIEYANVYEKEQPILTVQTWLDDAAIERDNGESEGSFDSVKSPALTFVHAMNKDNPGQEATVKLKREGQGRVYYKVQMTYAETDEKATAVNSGIEVQREYHVERDGKWILLQSPMKLLTGELVRVDLYVSLPAPRYFVVVDDPIPGGLEPVNRDLATTSLIDADKAGAGQYAKESIWFTDDEWLEYGESWWSFYHKELRHHAAIFYSDYLTAGNYHLSYVAQAIAPGDFGVMATHAEEMYEPEVFGSGKPAKLKVVRDSK
ncbi:MG2 domain-containing protein [Candidatus Halobeggiatoa sp. HSG11]|nr:MG2 domain-containing protein [Candidatus Halobeggiatoa sp. HSG11]